MKKKDTNENYDFNKENKDKITDKEILNENLYDSNKHLKKEENKNLNNNSKNNVYKKNNKYNDNTNEVKSKDILKENHLYKYSSYREYSSYKYYSVRKKGIMGLRNLTNTCFMNSSLQCLAHIKPFYEKIIQQENTLKELGLAFYYILKKIYSVTDEKCISPRNLLKFMSAI